MKLNKSKVFQDKVRHLTLLQYPIFEASKEKETELIPLF